MTGATVGRLTVIAYSHTEGKVAWWRCRCACAPERDVLVRGHSLRGDRSQSCGCIRNEATTERSFKHGAARRGEATTEFNIWVSMRARCLHERDHAFADYGGRGITVCERWRESFATFLADMGPRPSRKHSVDRIDNDGPYSPENCRWATSTEQCRNRRNNRWITAHGETMCLVDWCARLGARVSTIWARLALGWSPERAVSTPVRRQGVPRSNRVKMKGIRSGMIYRCTNATSPGFRNYGGRGITVCDRWLASLDNFIEDVGSPPTPKHSVDRIDNDGNYEPGNVRWATQIEQHTNKRPRRATLCLPSTAPTETRA